MNEGPHEKKQEIDMNMVLQATALDGTIITFTYAEYLAYFAFHNTPISEQEQLEKFLHLKESDPQSLVVDGQMMSDWRLIKQRMN